MTSKPISTVPWDELLKPFDEGKITWRVVKTWLDSQNRPHAKLSCYVEANLLRERLNTVLTPSGWQTAYRNVQTSQHPAFLCRLSIWDKARKDWVYREAAVDFGKIEGGWEDSVAKGAVTRSFRAACMQFGIDDDFSDLGEMFVPVIKTSTAPTDRKVVRFKSPVKLSSGKEETVKAWCERPKVEDFR